MSASQIEKWGLFETDLIGPKSGNPYLDVQLEAVFSLKSRTVRVPGFYDGDGVYRIRFMPDEEGDWRFETRSDCPELNGKNRRFHRNGAFEKQPRSGICAQQIPFRLCRRHALSGLWYDLLRLDPSAA